MRNRNDDDIRAARILADALAALGNPQIDLPDIDRMTPCQRRRWIRERTRELDARHGSTDRRTLRGRLRRQCPYILVTLGVGAALTVAATITTTAVGNLRTAVVVPSTSEVHMPAKSTRRSAPSDDPRGWSLIPPGLLARHPLGTH